MPEQAPVVFGKYQLLELLARGGMAEVYKAKSHGVEGFEKILVVKRILPELSRNPRFVEMFVAEAKLAVHLSHANIVQVFDLGLVDGRYFIAMEYVGGHDLATLLRLGRRANRPMPVELAVYVAGEVARALDYAHRRRDAEHRPLHIVHRDVSPQNVLVSFEGEVKLTDFGIAKARTIVEDGAEEGVVKGKYAYMSPEQAEGREVDARTDLFALGVCLYETLAGFNPFVAGSDYDTLLRVRQGRVAPLTEVAPHVPAELADIVARAMHPDRDARIASAERLYQELVQFLYTAGRRIGAHELARYVEQVSAETRLQPGQAQRLRLAFDVDGAEALRDATPVEVPAARVTRRPGAASATGVRRPTTSGLGLVRQQVERRDVTALCVRLPAGGELDALHSVFRRHGGVVVERAVSGDGTRLHVLFGTVDPDGRDTEGAARCGLRVQALLRKEGIRDVGAGLHAGRLHVDLSGELVRDESYEAVLRGAQAASERAGEGDLVASQAAEAMLRAGFELREQPAESGAQARWFVVASERDRSEAQGRFVGRKQELRRIGEVLALATKRRRRVLAIVGEAGMGKSRLLSESARRLRLGGHDVGMVVASVARQGRDVPFSAVHELLRVVLGIEEIDAPTVVRDKIGRLRELGVGASELAWVESLFGVEAAAPEDPVRVLRGVLTRIAHKLAEDRLTVLAFDGAEAMDDESQAVVDGLLRETRETRLVVVLAYRPGFVHAWSDLPGYETIELGPLSDEDVVRLVGVRLGVDEIPMDLLADVTSKSAGNPLFVEEYLGALMEARAIEVREGKVSYRAAVAALEVPKTLRGIVASRLGRLAPLQRQLLQVAAVIGERFTADVVARVLAQPMETVRSALEGLVRRHVLTGKPAAEMAFAHELVREVLYEGLALEGRRELHGAVAEAIETLHPDRLDEAAERLAEHHRLAGRRAEAVAWYVRAADRFENEHALAAAAAAVGRAVELMVGWPGADRERLLELYRRLGELSFRARDLERGAERMAAAHEMAESLGRDEYVARFATLRGRMLVHANRFAEGRQWLEKAREIATRLGDVTLLRDATLGAAEGETKNGEYARAAQLLEEALALCARTGEVRAQVRCLMSLSLARAALGQGAAALETLARARELATGDRDRFTECELLKTEALVRYYVRDHEGSLDCSLRALELAREHGFAYEASVNAHNAGESMLRLGDFKRAFALLRQSYELAREHGFEKLEHVNLRVLGYIDAVRFGSDEGRRRIVEAHDYALRNGYVWDLLQSKYLLALADHALGDVEAARRGLRETLRLAAECGDRRWEQDAEEALRALEAGGPVPLPR
ncbi:MAG: protein kinase [Myxococcota bacterium]|nr:protein kinase [Myxococcota bacterium]MDW8361239.1 protein kinase [Myxococcales bacterium]